MTDVKRDGLGWDLADFFAGPDDPALDERLKAVSEEAKALGARVRSLPLPGVAQCATWVDALLAYEALFASISHIRAYVFCAAAADPSSPQIGVLRGRADRVAADGEAIETTIQLALGRCDPESFEALVGNPRLATAADRLRRWRAKAQVLLPEEQERLIADMNVDGLKAWARLYDAVRAKLSFEVELVPGRPETVPMARRFEMLWHSDAHVRGTAFRGINSSFARVEDVVAACLGGIVGTWTVIHRHRGDGPLDAAARENRMKATTVATMIATLRERRDVFHRYLKLKAKLLGLSAIGVQDRSAPIASADAAPIPLAAATETVLRSWDRVAPAMRRRVDAMFEKGWVAVEPVPGGTGYSNGGFCVHSPLIGQPRVYLDRWTGLYNEMTVYAHEIGHGLHFALLSGQRPFNQDVPAAFAETASIVAEQLLRGLTLNDRSVCDEARRAVLGAQLDAALNYLARIPRDFDFELSLYEAHAERPLDVERVKSLHVEAHRAWFAGALRGDDDDRYGWASQQLLFWGDAPFYNFPYTFGFSLASRISAELERDPAFVERYERFLAATGSAPVEEAVATTLGFDVEQPAFWNQVVDAAEAQLRQLETLTVNP